MKKTNIEQTMRRNRFLFSFALLLVASTASTQGRSTTNFNTGWKFILDSTHQYNEPTVNDAAWRTLNLPHDWSIELPFDSTSPTGNGGGALRGGTAWYRKTFTIPLADKAKNIFIHFDGVYQNSEVWINGHSLGVRPNGYASFRYDLTPYIKYGTEKNNIAVKVDNQRQPNSRWYSGSGIYRDVRLEKTAAVYIDNWGTFVTTPVVTRKEATIVIQTKTIVPEGNTGLQLFTTVVDAKGLVVAKSIDAVNTRGDETRQTIKVLQPRLWSVDKPHLYKVISQIRSGTQVMDTYETAFGIRFFNFDKDKGFSLNGKPLKILGVCNHHDLGALGTAFNVRAAERQLEILKAMGCNGIRTSHNPPAPQLLDLCDKMGFIVMDEAFDMWAKSKTKYDYHLAWKDWHVKDLQDQILRDRNHPSVFMWSVGNEITEQYKDDKTGDTSGRVIARELVSIVKALDTSRPVVTANNETSINNNIIQSGAFDLIGYNYHHEDWAPFEKRWPGKKLIVTESTSALQTRGHYDLVNSDTVRRWPKRWDLPFKNPAGGFTVSAYDHVSTPWGSTHEESIKELKRSDHVSGMYIWTGFDYIGEPTPYPWPARSSYFGIIDLAGFPKDVYYLYQSEFTSKPVLHIYPHWNWKAGETVDVVSYYNNADEVELFLNGKSVGMRS
ncbi:MAG TPA: glycoside hydrolase family 2 TIM barrel-domain containing protein, partial [Flavisolibacter sp.]|nr:glycoside hydrolase family 2 TIM barrel-domain containing protein [Flavisolibacter sp.]